MGYCPFSVLSHDTVDCIVKQASRGSQGQAGHGHDTTLRHGEERPRHDQEGHDTTDLRARAHGLARLSRDTNCIVVGGRPCGSRYSVRLGRWVVSRDRLATRRRSYDTARLDTHGGAMIQCATRPARPATRPVLGLRHGRPQAATRPTTRPRHGRPGRSACDLCM